MNGLTLQQAPCRNTAEVASATVRARNRNSTRQRLPLTPTDLREATQAILGKDARVDAAALFGSYVRGRVRGSSDVDPAVLLSLGPRSDAEARQLRSVWEEEFTRSFKGYPVQVIVLPYAPLLLRRNITREGQLLLERRPGAWRAYRHRVLNEWRDRARVRERFWRRFLQRWKEVGFGERYCDHSAAFDAMRRVRASFTVAGGHD
ncbi:MAG: nucleotidyltransferase domain-containing protein [Armatimonadetes bacterium]|nr:nucleotidyltransferase domain-containing protein [Armatimonadota bacterium]